MGRTRKTPEEIEMSAFMGARLETFRREAGWTLEELAGRVGLSAGHLKSLESGRYSFSSPGLYRIAMALRRPIAAFFPSRPQGYDDRGQAEWQALFQALNTRDRTAVTELARSLAGADPASVLRCWKRMAVGSGRLVSFEGIDGVVLQEQGQRLVDRLNSVRPGIAELCIYDFDTGLWRFMFRRFREITANPTRAFERTLLFSCERLHRQETRIRPAIRTGKVVVTLYHSIASVVFQKIEGLSDTTVVEAVGCFLLDPDMVVVFDSDPGVAASRAVPHRPSEGRFYSPYEGEAQFAKARELYRSASEERAARGEEIRLVDDARGEGALDREVDRVVESLVAAVSCQP